MNILSNIAATALFLKIIITAGEIVYILYIAGEINLAYSFLFDWLFLITICYLATINERIKRGSNKQ